METATLESSEQNQTTQRASENTRSRWGRVCTNCSNAFEVPELLRAFSISHRVKLCPDCAEEAEKADNEQLRQKSIEARKKLESPEDRIARWSKICPAAFLATDPSKLPSPTKLQQVLAWKYGPKGLLCHGDTGKGKSRCAWYLVRREFIEGRRVAFIDSSFAFEYAAKFSSSSLDAFNWICAKRESELLLLDDVFKVKLTESVEQALFAIIDHRFNHALPIIATTNDTGESITERMSGDRGPALVRRLREMCNVISF